MTAQSRFDLIVIGSGPGGYKAAVTAAHLGARVALIEKGLPGGTCLNQGCIPKKAMLYIASLIEDVNSLQGRGLKGTTQGDFAGAWRHKEEVISGIRGHFPLWLRHLGVNMFTGAARLLDPRSVEVRGEGETLRLQAERIILATGSHPRQHPVCRHDGEKIIHSGDFMRISGALPRRILIVGGGAIGVELGYLCHQFGSEVTIVDTAPRLLNKPEIPLRASGMLQRKFHRLGIQCRLETAVSRCHRQGETVTLGFSDDSEAEFDCVLVAIGREPRTAELGLDAAGIRCDARGFIETNEFLETSVTGIYAVGDVKEGPMTANAALHDAKVAATNAVNGNELARNYRRVPVVIDTALEIAAVGLSEDMAESAGFEPDVARANYAGSAKALGRHDAEGFVEVIHDEETGQMLGGCIVGPEAGEQIQMLTAACQSPRGLWFLKDISYSHPSWCEELENAVDPYTAEFLQSGKAIFRPGIYAITD